MNSTGSSRRTRSLLITLLFAPVPLLAGLPFLAPGLSRSFAGAPAVMWIVPVHMIVFIVLAWRSGGEHA